MVLIAKKLESVDLVDRFELRSIVFLLFYLSAHKQTLCYVDFSKHPNIVVRNRTYNLLVYVSPYEYLENFEGNAFIIK